MTDESAPAGDPAPGRPGPLVAAVVLGVVEAAAIVAYCVGIGVSAWQTPGTVSAAPAEIVIYLIFAAGILGCARGLWTRRRGARTPFGVVQLFGLVVGWTLTQGDGDVVHARATPCWRPRIGIALVMSPQLGDALE